MPRKDDSLSPEKMQLFLAGLAGLAPAEIGKAKQLYIRNAIDEYEAEMVSAQATKWLWLLFALVPLFWPFLYVAKKTVDAQLELARKRIHNAIEVWADDLGGQQFAVERLVPIKWI